MSIGLRALTLSAGLLLAGASLPAHHSFAEYYVEQDTIEIEGDIVEFQYRNPHSWIHVAALDAFRQQKVFSAEWAGTSRLERDGINKTTLHVGDSVRIWASPNRNPNETRIRLKRIRRADGWEWGQRRGETR